jgi:hypothetical protein
VLVFLKQDFCNLFFVSMRVRQGGAGVRTSPRSRPCSQQQQQQQQQQAVYKIYEGKEPLILLGGAGTGGFDTGRNPMSMICGEKNAGGGGFRLIRHHSAVNEHDIRANSSSLLRTVSELREELHLGLPRKKNNQKTALDVVSGFPAITTDAKKKQTSCGTRSDAALNLFTEVSHQVPLFPGAKNARHIDGFVYKNYSLQNRRTLSFPVGKEYVINEYVGKRKGRQQQSTPPPPLPRSFSFTTTHLTETLTVAKDDTGGGGAVSCNMDFDAEVDRHSKMDLFLQAAFTVLTTVAGIFTVYIYMRFFMSSRHDGGLLHHQQEVPLQHESSFAALQEEEDLGPVSFFYYCNMLARVLFFPFLAILIAVVCAIITSRAWRNFLDGDSMWSRSHDMDTCSHCEEVEDSRMRIEQADEKVQRAQQAKQQFMAYVFHNIRG